MFDLNIYKNTLQFESLIITTPGRQIRDCLEIKIELSTSKCIFSYDLLYVMSYKKFIYRKILKQLDKTQKNIDTIRQNTEKY